MHEIKLICQRQKNNLITYHVGEQTFYTYLICNDFVFEIKLISVITSY